MTAGHDGYDDGDDMDALMSVIAGEPLPDEARDDAALLAEHRAATADVALLREQLGIIGNALARPAGTAKPAPARVARPRRTWRPRAVRLAFGALAVAAVAAVLSGMAWLLTQGGNGITANGADSSAAKAADGAKSAPQSTYMACARLVVEGDVTSVERVPGTERRRVSLHVTRYYKPAKGRSEVTFLTDGTIAPRPRTGEHVLVGFHGQAPVPDMWVTGRREIADQRAAVLGELDTLSPTASPACD